MSSILKRITVGSGIMLFSMLIMKSMVFVNYVIAARLLSPDDYGAWSIVLNIQNFAVVIASFGIPIVLTKKVSQFVEGNSSMAQSMGSALLTIVVASSAVVALGYLVLAQTIATDLYSDERLVTVLRLSSLFVFVSALNTALSAFLQGCQRISTIAKVNAVVAVIWQPVSFLMISAVGLSGAVLAQVFATALSACIFYFVSRRVLRVSWAGARRVLGDRTELRYLVSLTIPSFLSTVMIAPAYWIGRTVLVLDWSFSTVGEFQIAESLSQILLIIPAAMSVPLLPLISELHARDAASVGRVSGGLLRLSVFVMIPLCMAVFPVMEFAIVFLYGAAYSAAHSPAVLMFTSSAFIAAATIVSNVIYGVGKMWDALLLNILWLASFLSAVMLLVPEYGGIGLAATYAVSYAIYLLVLLSYFRRQFGVPVMRVGLFLSFFMAFVLVYMWLLIDASPIPRTGLTIASVLTFVVAGYTLVLERSDRIHLASFILRRN